MTGGGEVLRAGRYSAVSAEVSHFTSGHGCGAVVAASLRYRHAAAAPAPYHAATVKQ